MLAEISEFDHQFPMGTLAAELVPLRPQTVAPADMSDIPDGRVWPRRVRVLDICN